MDGFRIELGEIETTVASHKDVADSCVIVAGTPPQRQYIVAFATPRVSSDSDSTTEKIDYWASVYDDVYDEEQQPTPQISNPEADNTLDFDVSGWTNSYDGKPIAVAAMKEWVDVTVQRIAALSGKRILELGFGTGLLMDRLVDSVDQYWGSDLSRQAVVRMGRKLRDRGYENKARVFCSPADDVSPFANCAPDLVVINSVVQYFPSAAYLRNVMTQCVELLSQSGGGKLFVGDVRNYGLLRVFHSSIIAHNASNTDMAPFLRSEVEASEGTDKELVLHPNFFGDFWASNAAVTSVRHIVKRAKYSNELSKFRYDVVVFVRGSEVQCANYDGNVVVAENCADALNALDGTAPCVVVYSVTNAQLAKDCALDAAMFNSAQRDGTTLADIRSGSDQILIDDTTYACDLWDAAEERG